MSPPPPPPINLDAPVLLILLTCSFAHQWLAERVWRRDPSQLNKGLYMSTARAYKLAILQEKKSVLNKRIEAAQSSSKALFSILRELEGKKKPTPLSDKSDAWCTEIQDALLGKINTHREVIKTRQARLQHTYTIPSCIPLPLQTCPPFSFKQISETDLALTVQRMRPTSCRGDLCPAAVIKGSIDILTPLITKIVNLSLASSCVPSIVKSAWITPLLKKDNLDPSVASNYRPITTVPFLLKILDRVAYLQIQDYLEQYSLLGSRQSGFRAMHGTESALIDLKNNLVGFAENGQAALLMLLDLSAAFDLVDHSTLVTRLTESFNFSPEAAGWIRSFLDDRVVRVFSGESSAPPASLQCGVPQGSCISPTLYNIYTKPLFDILDDLGVGYTNYADDTQVFLGLTGRYEQDSCAINNIYTVVQAWMANNFLALNDSKTELMLVGTSQRLAKLGPDYSHFTLAGCSIPVVTSVKTLGVCLGSTLSMKTHVSHLHSSCAYLTKLLFQIRQYLSLKNMSTLACALVNAKLDYCSGLLAGTSASNLARLQRIQNGAVRAVFGLGRRDHVSDARRSLHWLPVQARIIYKTCLLTYKCQSGLAPSYLASCLKPAPVRRTLRSNQDLLLWKPRYRLENFGGSAFSVQAPLMWNSLPLPVRSALTLPGFKQALKTHLFRDLG